MHRSVAGKGKDLLYSEYGAPWELVYWSGSYGPWQVRSGKCASESLYPYVRCASVAWREVYMRPGEGQGWREVDLLLFGEMSLVVFVLVSVWALT